MPSRRKDFTHRSVSSGQLQAIFVSCFNTSVFCLLLVMRFPPSLNVVAPTALASIERHDVWLTWDISQKQLLLKDVYALPFEPLIC